MFVVVNTLGAVGWWLGSRVGAGTALTVSAAASPAGVWVGWQMNENSLS